MKDIEKDVTISAKKKAEEKIKIAQSYLGDPKSQKRFKEFCIIHDVKLQEALGVLVAVACETPDSFRLFTKTLPETRVKNCFSMFVTEFYNKKVKGQFKVCASRQEIRVELAYGSLFEFISTEKLFQKYILSRMIKN